MQERNGTGANAIPSQVDETVESLAALHAQHVGEIGHVQRLANAVTKFLGRPAAVLTTLTFIAAWIVGNAVAALVGVRALDQFPFPDLAMVATVGAFLMTLLILTTQRHEQEIARRRDQLTLHMAVLTEKKIAKVVALLEEQRRDNPMLPTRNDPEAVDMAEPSDPSESLDRIEASDLKR